MATIHIREARARNRLELRRLGAELREMREDAGRSQRAVADAAGLSQGYLSKIEAGIAQPSLEVLRFLSAALGADLSVKSYPNTGPRIRDRLQLRMEQAALEIAHPRWRSELEVPVYRPVRGIIDLVLHDRAGPDTVASEAHSGLRRVEQQVRWASQKADALAALPGSANRRVCRLLLLRNTAANRALIRTAPDAFRAAYPGRASDAFDALTGPGAPFPGAALLWVDIEANRARVLPSPPRGVGVGR